MQSPSRGIDGGGVLQRRFDLRLDTGEQRGLVGEKDLDRHVVLFLVARNASWNEVAGSVRSGARLGNNVIKVERHIYSTAIGTMTTVPLENVFPNLVTSQRTLLIPDA